SRLRQGASDVPPYNEPRRRCQRPTSHRLDLPSRASAIDRRIAGPDQRWHLETMRPSLLDPLFAPVGRISGIGPKTARQLGTLLGTATDREPVLLDLLFHMPAGMIDRRLRPEIAR